MAGKIALLVCAALTALACAVLPTDALAAGPQGALCQISGKAVFSKGLTGQPTSLSYTFTGKLTGCRSNASKYTKALISARGSGSEACEGGTSKGVATIQWTPTVASVVNFTTTSAGALVDVSGKVVGGFGKGDDAHGNLVFQADPQQCAGAGVKTAAFNGTTEYGSP